MDIKILDEIKNEGYSFDAWKLYEQLEDGILKSIHPDENFLKEYKKILFEKEEQSYIVKNNHTEKISKKEYIVRMCKNRMVCDYLKNK